MKFSNASDKQYRHHLTARTVGHSHEKFFELLETRTLLSASPAIEPIDGVGNNVANPTWASAGADLIRLAAAAYENGFDSPALSADQSARAISNILNNQANPANPSEDIATIDGKSLSDFGYSFGQFMDHDLDLTPDGGAWMPITVAADDAMGAGVIPFTRSATDPNTGTDARNPAQQVTTVTSYLDLSQVYGSSQTVSDAIRSFTGGLLKTSPGNMLPLDSTAYFTPEQITALNMANDSGAAAQDRLYAAGDRRANENIELTALQTLFMRNHNAIANQLHASHPKWTDEQLYQEARKLNIAEYQMIVYNGWLPAVLGPNALPQYRGYQSDVNATIANEFSTVAFRFGHSLLSAEIERQNNNGTDIADVSPDGSTISLAEDFFDPYLLDPTGEVDPLTGHTSSDIGPILKAEADGVSQATDLLAVGDVRNLLFGNGGAGGEDLMARDVQRDRDNGIPDYNSLRVAMGLSPITSFADISSDPKIQAEFATAYPGGVNTIDAFEGGLAEAHVAGSDLGPLFQRIIVDQFTRLRDGDRFFYLNESFNRQEMQILRDGNTLTKVIEANTPVTNLQENIFVFKASIRGTVGYRREYRHGSWTQMGVGGLTLELEDADGNVLATTTTDSRGNYVFTQLSGPSVDSEIGSGISATGTYRVVLALAAGPHGGGSMTSQDMPITSGDTNLSGIDFTLDYGPHLRDRRWSGRHG
jgi:peroxidase